MDTLKLRPSRNTEERLQAGMPIDRAFIGSRLTSIYAVMADCGVFVERLKSHEDYTWLHNELRDVEAAIDVVRKDLANKGDML